VEQSIVQSHQPEVEIAEKNYQSASKFVALYSDKKIDFYSLLHCPKTITTVLCISNYKSSVNGKG